MPTLTRPTALVLTAVACAALASTASPAAAATEHRTPPHPAARAWPHVATSACPATLHCEWLPAPYAQLSADPTSYGNHDLANRPATTSIDTIVIHDTEGYYPNDVAGVQDPAYLGWQYTIRSSDGHVAQHLSPRDIGWQAGNWYVNTHSIGVEHEGFAAKGATWFSPAQYRSSATLVRYLADRFHVPLDRGHIIGHDQVPGTTPATTAGMHWDPGPYWDWARYFELLGAPLSAGTRPASVRPAPGQVVRVLPTFATNVQPLTGCTAPGAPCPAQGSNVLPVRSAPSRTAPLVADPTLGPSSSWDVSDWGAKVATGTDYVVGAVSGDWVGIWFAGRLGWVEDPATNPTLRVRTSALVARPVPTGAATYGRALPEPSAYPAGLAHDPVTPLQTRLAPGQAYPVVDLTPPTDDYVAKTFSMTTPGDHLTVVGTQRYVLVDVGHRLAYVRAGEVSVATVHG